MKLSFRQGIARYQTDISSNPIFLQRSPGAGNFIDLVVSPDPTVVVFAHRDANYIVEENKTVLNAWGPISGSNTTHLYWDINLLTGALTRGTTVIPPMYAGSPPASPIIDQHWYNTTDNVMRVWNGMKWVEVIRTFAGHISSSAIIRPNRLGSEAGITGNFEGGNIILDAYNKPLRQSDGTFVTSSTNLIISNNSAKKVKFETEILNGMAAEPIPKFTLVQMRSGRQIVVGRSSDFMSRVAGLVTEDLHRNEVGYVIPDGLVRNESWNFPAIFVNRPIFCGLNGEVTVVPPKFGVSQICGYVFDRDSVYINIMAPVILDDVYRNLPPVIVPPALAPVADFYTSTTTGRAPFNVTFTSVSTGSPTQLEWDFNNDGIVEATGQIVTYTFRTPGTYTVRLRAVNAFGEDAEIKNSYIVVQSGTSPIPAPPAPTPTPPGPPVPSPAPGPVPVPTPAPSPSEFYTNLGVRLGGPNQVMRNTTFQVSITVTNDSYYTATNVTRQIVIPDLKAEQIVVSGLPEGSTTKRVTSRLIIDMPVLATIPSGKSYGPINFSIKAPQRAGALKIHASVSSTEKDATPGDNDASISVEVKL